MTKSDIPRDLCGAFSLFPLPFFLLYRTNVDYWTTGKKKDNNNKKKRKKRENLGAGSGDVPGGFFQGNDQFCPTLNETPCEACLFVGLLGGCLINQVTSHFECFLRKPRLNQS